MEKSLVVKPLSIGGPERDRTADLLNANQALSQLSYWPKRSELGQAVFEIKEQTLHLPLYTAVDGGPNRNCTCDPRVISTVLC